MNKDNALKLALEALENHEGNYKLGDAGCERHDKTITAIKEALAAPVQEPVATLFGSLPVYDTAQPAQPAPVQEPVGKLTLGGVIDTSDGPEYDEWGVEWNTKAIETLQEKLVTSDSVMVMIYTTPPAQPAVPLTDEQTLQAIADEYNAWIRHHAAGHTYDDFLAKRVLSVKPFGDVESIQALEHA